MTEEKTINKKLDQWKSEIEAAQEAVSVAELGRGITQDRLQWVLGHIERYHELSQDEKNFFKGGTGMSMTGIRLLKKMIQPEKPEEPGEVPSLEKAVPKKRERRTVRCPYCSFVGSPWHVQKNHAKEIEKGLGGIAGTFGGKDIHRSVLESIRGKYGGKEVERKEVDAFLHGFYPWMSSRYLEHISVAYLGYTAEKIRRGDKTYWRVIAEEGEKPP